MVRVGGKLELEHKTRFAKIAEKLAHKDILKAILDCSTACPVALLRVPSTLYSIVSLARGGARTLVELNALNWIAQMSHPGFYEYMINSVRVLPTYVASAASEGVAGLPSVRRDSLSEQEARSRLLLRIPTARDAAAELLLVLTLSYSGDVRIAMLRSERFCAVLRYWLRAPLLNYDDDSGVLLSFLKILKALCENATAVEKLFKEFDLVIAIMRCLYLPAAFPVREALVCLHNVIKNSKSVAQALMDNDAIMEALFPLFFSSISSVSYAAADCLELLRSLPGWKSVVERSIKAGIFTESYYLSLMFYRDKRTQACAQLLQKAYLELQTPHPTDLTRSPSEWREKGNVDYREKSYIAAATAYTHAISTGMLHSNLEEVAKACGNRAQCRLQLGSPHDALRDASLSIYVEFLDRAFGVTHDPEKIALLSKNLQRRSSAFRSLADLVPAVSDLTRAFSLTSNKETLILLKELIALCEARMGWRIICSECGALFHWLKVCSCGKVAYCSVGCDLASVAKH